MKDYHFNKGIKTDIALVFSCPGKKEEEQGKPVSGQTGKNLDYFLTKLFEKLEYDFTNRYDFRITNSVKSVYHKNLTPHKTEPTRSEIKDKNNLIRLHNELYDIERFIFCFGKKAELALSEIQKKSDLKLKTNKIFAIKHLSNSSLNRIKIEKLTGSLASEFRINTLVNDLFEKLR
ncbi:uracil-DNA glycosylase family protein [Flavobacterium sp. FZUC8N2.13]|uniref:Uracil-DNA glycosylase family protein n=1 Tax=Flavobacterium zubiriense TaxID=3138075 RepID=A0ABV4TEP5_9FLAO